MPAVKTGNDAQTENSEVLRAGGKGERLYDIAPSYPYDLLKSFVVGSG